MSSPVEILRETDTALADKVSNMDGVLCNVSYDGRTLNWGPVIEHCVVLSNGEDAIQVYEQKARHIWEVMTIFAPTCRGRRALDTAFAMRDWMLPYVDVAFGSVPDRLKAAKWFYRKIGGSPVAAVETRHYVFTANPNETLFAFVNPDVDPSVLAYNGVRTIPIGTATWPIQSQQESQSVDLYSAA